MSSPTAAVLLALALSASLAVAEPPEPLDAARELHLAGRWTEALAAYGRVAEGDDPAAAAIAHNNSCTIFNTLADYPAALEAYRLAGGVADRILQQAPDDTIGRYHRSLAEYRWVHLVSAVKHVTCVVPIRPQDVHDQAARALSA